MELEPDREDHDQEALADEGGCGPAHPLTPRDVLLVLAEFDRFGGSSFELIAWELGVAEDEVIRVGSRAFEKGFVKRAGTDPVTGEDMWRLTGSGREAAYMSSLDD